MNNLVRKRETEQILSRIRIKTREVNKEIPMVEEKGKGRENRTGAQITEIKIELDMESRDETTNVVRRVTGIDALEIVLKSRVDIEIVHLNLTVRVEKGGDTLVKETHQHQQINVVVRGMSVVGKTIEGTKATHAREKIGTKFWNLENILAAKNLTIEYHPQKNHRVMYR